MNTTTYNDSLSLTGLRWLARVSGLAVAGVIAFLGVAQGFDPAGMQPKELALAF